MWRGLLCAGFFAVAAVVAASPSPALADELQSAMKRGRELFQLCAQCHGAAGEGDHAYLAPGIAGLPAWYVQRQLEYFQNGARGSHFDDLEGLRMRPMAWSLNHAGDVPSVSLYTASLPAVPPPPTIAGDAAAGARVYTLCASCHGAAGEGAEMLHGPPLTVQGDWYLKAQLQKYKDGVRGKSPLDTTGPVMIGFVAVMPTEQDFDNMVAYIQTLPPPSASPPAPARAPGVQP